MTTIAINGRRPYTSLERPYQFVDAAVDDLLAKVQKDHPSATLMD